MTWVWKTVYQYPQTRSTIPCNYDAKIIVCTILCLLNLGVEDMMLSHWFTQGKTSGYFCRVLLGNKMLLLKEYEDWFSPKLDTYDKTLNTLNLTKIMVNIGHFLFKNTESIQTECNRIYSFSSSIYQPLHLTNIHSSHFQLYITSESHL